jgi:hypothetical protein
MPLDEGTRHRQAAISVGRSPLSDRCWDCSGKEQHLSACSEHLHGLGAMPTPQPAPQLVAVQDPGTGTGATGGDIDGYPSSDRSAGTFRAVVESPVPFNRRWIVSHRGPRFRGSLASPCLGRPQTGPAVGAVFAEDMTHRLVAVGAANRNPKLPLFWHVRMVPWASF